MFYTVLLFFILIVQSSYISSCFPQNDILSFITLFIPYRVTLTYHSKPIVFDSPIITPAAPISSHFTQFPSSESAIPSTTLSNLPLRSKSLTNSSSLLFWNIALSSLNNFGELPTNRIFSLLYISLRI